MPAARRHRWLQLALAGLLPAAVPVMATSAPAPGVSHVTAALTCRFEATRDDTGRVMLTFTLRHTGPQVVHLLRWGSPFEGGWFAPFVRAYGNAGELPFQGALRKRGDPSAADYLTLQPGQPLTARLALSDAYPWPPAAGPAGTLRLKAAWRWHDVMTGDSAVPPRPRQQHQGADQDCGELTLGR